MCFTKGTPAKLIMKINAMSHALVTRINQASNRFDLQNDLQKQLDKLFRQALFGMK